MQNKNTEEDCIKMGTQKHYSSWGMVALALVAVLVLATGCAGLGAGSPGYPTNQISVAGEGQAYGKPDVAYVDLGIDVTNPNVSPALDQANQTLSAVQEAIKKAGVADEDIQTTSFNVYPEDRYDPQTGQPTGERVFHVQNILRITVRDVSKVGAVIDAGTGAGANTVHNVSFGMLETAELAAQARTEAVADAKKRAEQLAKELGVKLGSATIISETYGSVPVYEPSFAAQDAVGGRGGAGAPVSSGQLVVSVQVNVTFNLTP
jgi:uncharacterized protein YggE